MPDFNKGDFTQQGVAGHVNANLRLNEKRLVNIDLTSNEAAEGCTITGTVKDLLNDKVYGIGSGVSGNIEITENGENINVAPYATATVNVSGGETIPKCTMSIVASEVGEDLWTKTFENGKYEFIPILDDNTTVVTCLYDAYGYPSTTYAVCFWAGFYAIGAVSDPSNVTNLVNLIVDEDHYICVIDPTQDSSCTISANEFNGGR